MITKKTQKSFLSFLRVRMYENKRIMMVLTIEATTMLRRSRIMMMIKIYSFCLYFINAQRRNQAIKKLKPS